MLVQLTGINIGAGESNLNKDNACESTMDVTFYILDVIVSVHCREEGSFALGTSRGPRDVSGNTSL